MVLEGTLCETLYDQSAILPDGKGVDARAGRSQLIKAGDVTYINDCMGLHKVANLTESRAVSLHIYAPGWSRPPLFDEVWPEVDAGGAEFDCSAWGDF